MYSKDIIYLPRITNGSHLGVILTTPKKKIVIVGGGAGGLELATSPAINLAARTKRRSRWWIATTAICGNRCCTKWRPVPSMTAWMRSATRARAQPPFQLPTGVVDQHQPRDANAAAGADLRRAGRRAGAGARIAVRHPGDGAGQHLERFRYAGRERALHLLDNPHQARRFHNEMLNLFLKFSAQPGQKSGSTSPSSAAAPPALSCPPNCTTR